MADAVAALGAEEAQALGGGQTLIPTLKQRLAMPSKLVSLSGIAEMKRRERRGRCADHRRRHHPCHGGGGGGGRLSGAGRTCGQYRRSGGAQPRHHRRQPGQQRPLGLLPRPRALGSGATIVTNAREIAADDYFQGMFTTALDEGEIITAVRFPVPEAANYQKFEQPASRFALVGVFVAKTADGGAGGGHRRLGRGCVPLVRGRTGAGSRFPHRRADGSERRAPAA